MIRKSALSIGVMVALVMGLTIVHANDTAPQPGTPADNECNPGGVLYREENQDGCPTDWYWKAGWYLARVNRGLLSRDDVPDEFTSVLPPLDTELPDPADRKGRSDDPNAPWVPQEPAVGTRWTLWGNVFTYEYLGPLNTLGNILGFVSITDDRHPQTNAALILARNEPEAQAICAALGTVRFVQPFVTINETPPEGGYMCVVW